MKSVTQKLKEQYQAQLTSRDNKIAEQAKQLTQIESQLQAALGHVKMEKDKTEEMKRQRDLLAKEVQELHIAIIQLVKKL